MPSPSQLVERQVFISAMGRICTPVSVISAFDGERPHGTTVSAFASLSLDPPMIMCALDQSSDLLKVLHPNPRFSINVLRHDASGIARTFAAKGADKFQDVPWTSRSGAPKLDGVLCWLLCHATEFVPGGDHTVVLATVLELDEYDVAPLTHYRRTFGTHAPHDSPVPFLRAARVRGVRWVKCQLRS
jgi:flavin reductase (DIM6/NTAB) family NADH-FMN oxidoreductase RutF